jgi:prevent-host-death family protein
MQNVQNLHANDSEVLDMEKSIGVTKARDQFRSIVDEVQYRGDKYVIKRHGKPAVAVVPVEIYENWKKQRQRLLELIHEVQTANPDADPDEVMQDVLKAQQAVRAQINEAG